MHSEMQPYLLSPVLLAGPFEDWLAEVTDVVTWRELPDAQLSRCLWPESYESLCAAAAAHPDAIMPGLLLWLNETYEQGGVDALWQVAHHFDLEGLEQYLLRAFHKHPALLDNDDAGKEAVADDEADDEEYFIALFGNDDFFRDL